MANMLGRTDAGFGGGVSSKSARLVIGVNDTNTEVAKGEFLVQSFSAQYSQNITQVFELQSEKVYYATARAQGQANLSTVFGPKPATFTMYSDLADPCRVNNIVYSTDIGCDSSNPSQVRTVKRTANRFTLQQYGFSVAVGDMLVQETMAGPIGELVMD